MSAICDWSITFEKKLKKKELESIMKILCSWESIETEKFEDVFTNNKSKRIWTDNSDAHNIWGDNYLEPSGDIYFKLVKELPDLSWVAESRRESESGGEGCISFQEADFSDGVLTYKTYYYVDMVSMERLFGRMGKDIEDPASFEEFCEYYDVDPSITEDIFMDHIDEYMEDDLFLNPKTNKVTYYRNKNWTIETYTVEECEKALKD